MQLTESALRKLVAQVISEQEEVESVEIASSEPSDSSEEKNLSDVQLVLTHLQKINSPQEQVQILSHLFKMIMGTGITPDELSREQRVQAIKNALESEFGTKSGPLVSALRNLLVGIK